MKLSVNVTCDECGIVTDHVRVLVAREYLVPITYGKDGGLQVILQDNSDIISESEEVQCPNVECIDGMQSGTPDIHIINNLTGMYNK